MPGEDVEAIPCSDPLVVTLAVEAFVIAEIVVTLPVNFPESKIANTLPLAQPVIKV